MSLGINIDAGLLIQVSPAHRPDRVSDHGRAWELMHPDEAAAPASVGAWLLNVPRAHPRWMHWMFGAIALDPARGFDRKALQFAEATHEFCIIALDPRYPLPSPKRWQDAVYLDYPEVKLQVELPSQNGDHAARAILGLMVTSTLQQGMSPDGCNRNYWIKAIDVTAHDIREGNRRV
jgi:hypothetical protein